MAYDEANDRLILFSGEDDTALPRPTDVWVLSDATGIGGTPSWVELFPTGGPPLGRFGGTTVYAPGSNRIIVFGGCFANCGFALSDVWVLENGNGLGGTPNWTQLGPSAAFGRAEHSAVYDAVNNRMIVFAGHTAFFGTDQSDVRVLTNADGTGGTPGWSTLAPTGGPPPPRRDAGMAYDQATNRLIVFGGGDFPSSSTSTIYNDVWVLTNANGLGGTPVWSQLTPLGSPPMARLAHAAHYDPTTNRLIVFGGGDIQGGILSFFNDLWVLTNANGIGGPPQWIQLSPGGTVPPARIWASSGYSVASNALALALGRNDILPTLFNDAWVLADANGFQYVDIDIAPGTVPNVINLKKKGVIDVAILSTDSFDATTVDPATVRFGPAEATEKHGAGHPSDVDGDLDDDLVLHFNRVSSGITCGSTSATLTGETFLGQPIRGTDSIVTTGC
jgi:hypothetical protein